MAALRDLLSTEQAAALREFVHEPTRPTPPAVRQRLLETLRKAEQLAQMGNPVLARQHVLRAIRIVEELP